MQGIVLVVIGVVSVISAGFFILLILDLRRSSMVLRDFLKNTEENLNPTLNELRETLTDIKKITGNVSAISDTARETTESLHGVAKNMKKVSGYVDRFGSTAVSRASAWRVGIKTGVTTLVKNLIGK